MLIIDTELAKQAIIQAEVRKPTFAKLKSGKSINLYFLELKGSKYVLAEREQQDDESLFYIVAEEDIGTEIFPDEEYNNTLNKLEEGLKDVISLLKKAKEIN